MTGDDKNDLYKIRYTNEKIETVTKDKLDAILKSGKAVFSVERIREK